MRSSRITRSFTPKVPRNGSIMPTHRTQHRILPPAAIRPRRSRSRRASSNTSSPGSRSVGRDCFRLVCRHIGSRSVGDTLRRSSLKKQKMRSVQMCSTEWARMELLIFSTHMITPMTLLYMDLETEEHPSASSLSEFDDQFKAQRIIPT